MPHRPLPARTITRGALWVCAAVAGVAVTACGSSIPTNSGSGGAASTGSAATTGSAVPTTGSAVTPAAAASTPATAAPTSSPAGGATVVPVVAAENFWGDITRQIGGAHAHVLSIISDPNADPHTYETDPKDAAAISAASFVVVNGVGYDDFATKLLAASPSASRTVIHVDELNHVDGDDANPHLWYDPAYVRTTADAITAALVKADPADASSFTTNEQGFLTAYQPYIAELARIKAKYAGAKVSYTERVPGYLVDTAGLVLGTPASFSQSVEDGNDPSPKDTAAFDADISGKKVKVLLYNGQVTDSQTTAIKALATKAGVPIVGVTETLPPSEKDFQTWQLDQATQVFTALGG